MRCRFNQADDLQTVIDLGIQSFTGIFPSSTTSFVPKGALRVGLSASSGLLQLMDNFPPDQMYGDSYGYRSGLNQSMISHLQSVYKRLSKLQKLDNYSTVLDIGSNDGTLLNFFIDTGATLIGIDPSSTKFAEFYHSSIVRSAKFFTADNYFNLTPNKASIVTSISMFYDLENPLAFAQDVHSILDDDGFWLLEQSYMPLMLERLAFDTICHEHYEYYSLTSLSKILIAAGFTIIDLSFNDINGGSFSLIVQKTSSAFVSPSTTAFIHWVMRQEEALQLHTTKPYTNFFNRIKQFRKSLGDLLQSFKTSGCSLSCLGASTKGNVLLQYCGLDTTIFDFVGEVNPNKFNCYTPGSNIPIVSESELLKTRPNYLLVLPWHFKNNFLRKKSIQKFREDGGKLIFPLPTIQVI